MPRLTRRWQNGGMSTSASTTSTTVTTIDVRTIPHQQRHPLIFQTFDQLQPGQAFELVVDHDPKPVLYQMNFMHQGTFAYTYLEQGPLWRVRMAKVQQAASKPAQAS